jgi:hypothetical protein
MLIISTVAFTSSPRQALMAKQPTSPNGRDDVSTTCGELE